MKPCGKSGAEACQKNHKPLRQALPANQNNERPGQSEKCDALWPRQKNLNG
jgi:hypothetical protein